MKKVILLAIICAFVFACKKDNSTLVPNFSDGFVKITSVVHTYVNDNFWTETFVYENDKLIRVEGDNITPRTNEFSYNTDNQLVEVLTIEPTGNDLIFRDSITYLDNGLIDQIFNFSLNTGSDLPLNSIKTYKYDNDDKIKTVEDFSLSSNEIFRTTNYAWDGDNISKIESTNSIGGAILDVLYKYDNKQNYKKSNPHYLQNNQFWTANNIIESEFIDHAGIIDFVCNPCDNDFEYNSNAYPNLIDYEYGETLTIEYE